MYQEDWGGESEEEQQKIHLFEVEVSEESLEKRDISVYDAAYDAIRDKQDIDAALAYARRYFAGEHSVKPNWEYLSDGEATAVKDVSHHLRDKK